MTVLKKNNVSKGNKEVIVAKTVTTSIIWLPGRSVGQCAVVRAILLPDSATSAQAAEPLIESYDVLEKKTEAINAYPIKNNKGEGKQKETEKKVSLTISRKDWAEFNGCINDVSNDQSLQWQSLQNLSVSFSLAVFCHNLSYAIACAENFRLKELSD